MAMTPGSKVVLSLDENLLQVDIWNLWDVWFLGVCSETAVGGLVVRGGLKRQKGIQTIDQPIR